MENDASLNKLDHSDIIYARDDLISQNFVSKIEDIINFELQKYDSKVSENIKLKLFGVVIEQLQNVMSYSNNINKKDKLTYESKAEFILGYSISKNKYFSKTVNQIKSSHKDKIISKLDNLNALKSAEIRKLTRELLRSGKNAHSRGAGIGFLEMAKRSSEKLYYDFKNKDGELYFELIIYI